MRDKLLLWPRQRWVRGKGHRLDGGRRHGLAQGAVLRHPPAHAEASTVSLLLARPQVDSCCGSQDHATAFAEYALFRDALNATGRRVLFNLCG